MDQMMEISGKLPENDLVAQLVDEAIRLGEEMLRDDATTVSIEAAAVEMAHELPGDIQAATRRNSNKSVWWALQNAREMLHEMRPGDRSPTDRYYAVAITEMEKVLAYFQTFVLNGHAGEAPSARDYAYTVPAGENGAPLCPYCAEELVWTRIETHDKSGWIKGWLCGCQFEDAVTEAVSKP